MRGAILSLLIALSLCLSSAFTVTGQEKGKPKPIAVSRPFDAIDRHALQAPEEAEGSAATLAEYLVKPARTDREKVRAIFRWIADRIAYNAEDFLAGKPPGDCSATAVLTGRKTVCEGYANLFSELCKHAGVEAVKIRGFSKGYGYVNGNALAPNHAWNAVKLTGRWHLLDATWAAGTVDATRGFRKRFDDYYFLTPPEHFVYTHFPDDPKWQLLQPPVSSADYKTYPKLEKELFKLGFTIAAMQKVHQKQDFRGFVKTFTIDDVKVRLLQAPMEKHLKAGTSYQFRVESQDLLAVATINDNQWQHFVRKGNVHEGTVKATPGKLALAGKTPYKANAYAFILEYDVEEE